MRCVGIFLAALVVLTVPAASRAADVQRFDGEWQTTVSCAGARDALGYAFRFVSTVKNGNFHGLRGTAGQAPFLQIDGKIAPDGDATLYANGLTGSKEFVPGRDTPRGTQYNYTISAHFEGSAGTGTRVEGRPCTLRFEKM